METFVLLPFFLLSRVPTDADNWRYGPEYTFVIEANMTILEGSPLLHLSAYHVYNVLKCRPRDLETLHCQFDVANTTTHMVNENGYPIEVYKDKESSLYKPFDIKFDQRGIHSLVILRNMDPWYLDMMRSYVSQLNIGMDLRHKTDDGAAFNTTESTYIGQCENLVNISSIAKGNVVSEMEDYEIVPIENSFLKKKRGEVLEIEKTRNLKNCTDKRDYIITGEKKNSHKETQMLSSRSRIEISDMGFDSYTENMVNVINRGITFSFYEKIRMNLISVRPAEEALEPFSNDTETVSLYVYSDME